MRKFSFITLSLAVAGTSYGQRLSPAVTGGAGSSLSSHSESLAFTATNLSTKSSAISADSIASSDLHVIGNIENGNNAGIFNVYPNPAVDNLWFSFQLPGQGTANVILYNSLGQKIGDIYNGSYDQNKTVQQLDISKLPVGNYLLSLKIVDSKNGTLQLLNRKFQVGN